MFLQELPGRLYPLPFPLYSLPRRQAQGIWEFRNGEGRGFDDEIRPIAIGRYVER